MPRAPFPVVFLAHDDHRYPAPLRKIPDPPAQLYVRGAVELLNREDHIAAVGTRRLSRYGAEAAARLVGALSSAGAPIVSGLAFGADAACHEAALDAHGPTIAVLAGGVADEDVTPPSHLGLARRILDSGGALVSEYASGTPSFKGQFLARNRIVCGMSRATLIIEAPLRSGAMFTARMTLEHGRDVYAVPGPITSETSEGTNMLISEGAYPAISPDYLLQTLGYATPERRNGPPLTPDECAILDAIAKGLRDPDDIAAQTQLPPQKIAAALTALALKGSIRN